MTPHRRVPSLAIALSLAATSGPLYAQATLGWRSEATNGNWSDPNNWWNGGTTTPPGSEILRFGNNNQLTMTNNASNTTRHRIIFDTGASQSRTINGTTANTFVAVGGNAPLIQNLSEASHTINFPITLGADGLILDNAASSNQTNILTIGGAIAGAGTLTLRSNGNTSDTGGGFGGNLHLGNAANTFTGDVRIEAGVVSFADDGSFGNSANKIILSGGGLVATENRTLAATRAIELSGGGDRIFRVYGARTLTINGAITGTGNVRHTDGGTLQLNGNNSFTGHLIAAGGSGRTIALGNTNNYTGYTHLRNSSTLRLDADNALPITTQVLLWGGTIFNVNGRDASIAGLLTGSSVDTDATVNLGGTGSTGTLTVRGNSSISGGPGDSGNNFYARITGTGSLNYDHATSNNALWLLKNSANDFTGDLIVTRGRMHFDINAGAPIGLGNANNRIVFNGDIVSTLGNNEGRASIQQSTGTSFTLGSTRSIVLNNGKEGTIYAWSTHTATVQGQITGGGNLRKEDGGTLRLENTTNNYSGLTRIASGTLQLGASGVIPDASSVEMAGGTFATNNLAETIGGLFGTGGSVSGGNTLTVLTSGNLNFAGTINNTTLRMAGSGTQTLSGTADNVSAMAVVDNGTLVLAKSGATSNRAIGASGGEVALTINGGTVRLNGGHNDQIYGDSAVSMTGGVFDLNGKDESFRGLTGNAGVVRNDASSTTSILTVGEIINPGTMDFSFGGAIENGAGTMALTKIGTGTFTITSAVTYTGNTTIHGGTMLIGTGGSLGNTAVTVGGTGASGTPTLAGGGTIGGATTIAAAGGGAAGTHAVGVAGVGNGIGSQSFSSDLSYGSGSTFAWDIHTGTDTSDGVTVGGNLAIASGAIFKVVSNTAFTDTFWDTSRTWNVFGGKNFGGFTLNYRANNADLNAGDFASEGYFTISGSSLNWTAVPEPGTALAGLLLTAGLLRRRREREG
jgi:autotransporter-associated beta strand protein